MTEKPKSNGIKKRKTVHTQELFKQVLDKLDRMDERWQGLEARQVMTEAAYQRQGTVIEEVNKRCMEKLGLKCPLVQDDEEDGNDENNRDE